MWESYRDVKFIMKTRDGDYVLDLPVGRERPIQELIRFELLAEGSIILDQLNIQIEISENRLTRR